MSETTETKLLMKLLSSEDFCFMSERGDAVVRLRDFHVADAHGKYIRLDEGQREVYITGYIQSAQGNGPTFKVNNLAVTQW